MNLNEKKQPHLPDETGSSVAVLNKFIFPQPED